MRLLFSDIEIEWLCNAILWRKWLLIACERQTFIEHIVTLAPSSMRSSRSSLWLLFGAKFKKVLEESFQSDKKSIRFCEFQWYTAQNDLHDHTLPTANDKLQYIKSETTKRSSLTVEWINGTGNGVVFCHLLCSDQIYAARVCWFFFSFFYKQRSSGSLFMIVYIFSYFVSLKCKAKRTTR